MNLQDVVYMCKRDASEIRTVSFDSDGEVISISFTERQVSQPSASLQAAQQNANQQQLHSPWINTGPRGW